MTTRPFDGPEIPDNDPRYTKGDESEGLSPVQQSARQALIKLQGQLDAGAKLSSAQLNALAEAVAAFPELAPGDGQGEPIDTAAKMTTTERQRIADLAGAMRLRNAALAPVPDHIEMLIEGMAPKVGALLLASPGGRGKTTLVHQLGLMAASDYAFEDPTAIRWLPHHNIVNPDTDFAAAGKLLRPDGEPLTVIHATWEDARTQLAKKHKLISLVYPELAEEHVGNRHMVVEMDNAGPMWGQPKTDDRWSNKLAEMTRAGRELLTMAEISCADILILDTIGGCYSDSLIDVMCVRRFTMTMNAWAKRSGITIIILAHTPKSNDGTVYGSADWTNGVRTVWMMADVSTRLADGRDDSEVQKRDAIKAQALVIEKANWLDMIPAPMFLEMQEYTELNGQVIRTPALRTIPRERAARLTLERLDKAQRITATVKPHGDPEAANDDIIDRIAKVTNNG